MCYPEVRMKQRPDAIGQAGEIELLILCPSNPGKGKGKCMLQPMIADSIAPTLYNRMGNSRFKAIYAVIQRSHTAVGKGFLEEHVRSGPGVGYGHIRSPHRLGKAEFIDIGAVHVLAFIYRQLYRTPLPVFSFASPIGVAEGLKPGKTSRLIQVSAADSLVSIELESGSNIMGFFQYKL